MGLLNMSRKKKLYQGGLIRNANATRPHFLFSILCRINFDSLRIVSREVTGKNDAKAKHTKDAKNDAKAKHTKGACDILSICTQ